VRWCAAANPAELLAHKRTAPLRMRRVPPKASSVLFPSRARTRVATPTDLVACEHPIAQAQGRSRGRNRHRGARVQRLEVLVAVMLARERRALADDAADGCTELAAALATLPSGLLEMVADAVAALGCADAREGFIGSGHTAHVRTPTLRRRPARCRPL
jgi:hypothetical protein